MLGNYPLGADALGGQASSAATRTLSPRIATGAVGTLTTISFNTITLPSVVGTGAAGSVKENVTEIIIVGVGASGQLGYLAEVATSNKAITGVAGTTAVGGTTESGKASNNLTGVSAVGGPGATEETSDSNEVMPSVVGTLQTGTLTLAIFARISVSGVAGTSAVGSTTEINDSAIGISVNETTGSTGTVTHTLSARKTLSSAIGTGQRGLLSFEANANTTLPSATAAVGQVGSTTETAVVFDYSQFAEQYSRNRVVYIPAEDTNYTVVIAA